MTARGTSHDCHYSVWGVTPGSAPVLLNQRARWDRHETPGRLIHGTLALREGLDGSLNQSLSLWLPVKSFTGKTNKIPDAKLHLQKF